ncbi:MAG: hypothetical protein Q7N50_03310 [Armatimonadota bacterium]|nr:hypothetical protein [Armatimonadota bacterium]
MRRIITALEGADIEYMLSGSVVSSLQGEPRSTHDIDIVIAIQEASTYKLIDAFPPADYYIDNNSVQRAIKTKDMVNLIDMNTGDKIDFWILTDSPFDQSRFSRRIFTETLRMQVVVSSPEDTILAKLRWAKLSGGSEKQFTDALRVYEVQFGKLDLDYLRSWAEHLGVTELLQRLTEEAEVV